MSKHDVTMLNFYILLRTITAALKTTNNSVKYNQVLMEREEAILLVGDERLN